MNPKRKRIVAKVDQLMALVDALETQITSARTTALRADSDRPAPTAHDIPAQAGAAYYAGQRHGYSSPCH